MKEYVELCKREIRDLEEKDGEFQAEIADMHKTMLGLKQGVEKAVAEGKGHKAKLDAAAVELETLRPCPDQIIELQRQLAEEKARSEGLEQQLAKTDAQARLYHRQLEEQVSSKAMLAAELSKEITDLNAVLDAKKGENVKLQEEMLRRGEAHAEEAEALRAEHKQERAKLQSKVDLLDSQVSLLSEIQEQLIVTQGGLAEEKREKVAMAERLGQAETTIKRLMGLNQDVLNLAVQSNRSFISSATEGEPLRPAGDGAAPEQPAAGPSKRGHAFNLEKLVHSLEDELKDLDSRYALVLDKIGFSADAAPGAVPLEANSVLGSMTQKGEQLKYLKRYIKHNERKGEAKA